MTISELSRLIRNKITPICGDREANAIIRLIFLHLKDWNQTQIIINSDQQASDWLLNECEKIIRRLLNHEPIQYILGKAHFFGMNLNVSPATLIPRPETEELVDLIISQYSNTTDLNILDIGTGSGAIAIALARNLRFPNITAIDISPDALNVAKTNAKNLHANITFLLQDIFTFPTSPTSPLTSQAPNSPNSPNSPQHGAEALRAEELSDGLQPHLPKEKFDIIVSNPPYIGESEKNQMDPNVLDFEPHSALFVPDNTPLIFYNRIIEVANNWLKKDGKLYFEINPFHANELAANLKSEQYRNIQIIKDIHGKDRIITATH